MLQQTVASVVTGYFTRWLAAFPTLEALAEAPKDKVLKLWEGLGYYSRARNLLKGAQYVRDHFGGELPSDPLLLKTIPGIGDYTAAAIAAFAFHQKIAAIDANVNRFVSRYLAITDKKEIQEGAHKLLPDKEPWITAEAMIEIGATICRKKPDCLACPVQSSCEAFRQNRQHELPLLTKKAATTYLEKNVVITYAAGKFLLKNPAKSGVMADLWEFPSGDVPEDAFPLTQQKHCYTRYSVTLRPFLKKIINPFDLDDHSWYSLEEMQALAFSSGHRRILKELLTLGPYTQLLL